MTVQTFVQKLREILSSIQDLLYLDGEYINLAECNQITGLNEQLTHDQLPVDPLIDAFHLIIEAAARSQVDLVKYGINELCKFYIRLINQTNEKLISTYFFKRLELIFQRCLMSDFPYHNEVWNYLGGCINTVGLFLLEHHYELATKELLQTFFHMGKLAAHQGMQTSSTQGYFRVLQNKAIEGGFEGLAASAKNFRFNLELY